MVAKLKGNKNLQTLIGHFAKLSSQLQIFLSLSIFELQNYSFPRMNEYSCKCCNWSYKWTAARHFPYSPFPLQNSLNFTFRYFRRCLKQILFVQYSLLKSNSGPHCSLMNKTLHFSYWTQKHWTGVDWSRLDRTGQDWTRLDWTGLDRTGLDWTGRDGTGRDWTGRDWTGLDWSPTFRAAILLLAGSGLSSLLSIEAMSV